MSYTSWERRRSNGSGTPCNRVPSKSMHVMRACAPVPLRKSYGNRQIRQVEFLCGIPERSSPWVRVEAHIPVMQCEIINDKKKRLEGPGNSLPRRRYLYRFERAAEAQREPRDASASGRSNRAISPAPPPRSCETEFQEWK